MFKKRIQFRERGQSLVEYGVSAIAVLVVAIAAWVVLWPIISDALKHSTPPQISFSSSAEETVLDEIGTYTAAQLQAAGYVQANRTVQGATAYWMQTSEGCQFGIQDSISGQWLSKTFADETCPKTPRNTKDVARLMKKLWNWFMDKPIGGPDSFTIKQLIELGGQSKRFMEAIIALAKIYGVSLLP